MRAGGSWHRIAGAVGMAVFAAGVAAAQQPTFRATVDQVSIDVSVLSGRNTVTGLTTADFTLDDNGVRQEIDVVPSQSFAVDVTLVMDVSGSVIGDLMQFSSNVRQVAALLRPADRLRIISFGSSVKQLRAMTTVSAAVLPYSLTPENNTSMNDGLFYALAWPVEPARRHLIVAFTDGYDTSSVIDEAQLKTIASESDAVLHAVLAPEVKRFGYPPASRAALIEAATRTGGASHKLSDAVKSFKEVLNDFRTSYVIRYAAHGVTREGWHDVTVAVARSGKFTIRSKKGYFVGGVP